MQRLLRTITLIAGMMLGLGFAQPAASEPDHGMGPFMGLQRIKDQLNLTTSQQVQWDAAQALAKSAHASIRQNRQQLRQAMQTELAKPQPDLAAVAALADSLQPANGTARRQARDAWLLVYATFSPEQKAVVKNALLAAMARMESHRQHRKDAPPNN